MPKKKKDEPVDPKNLKPEERMKFEIAAELGLDYIDLNVGEGRVGVDWAKDSYDAGDHLNASGARKVSTAVGALLAERYGAPDHRGDDSYSSWAEASSRVWDK